jgi:hypothetical protein
MRAQLLLASQFHDWIVVDAPAGGLEIRIKGVAALHSRTGAVVRALALVCLVPGIAALFGAATDADVGNRVGYCVAAALSLGVAVGVGRAWRLALAIGSSGLTLRYSLLGVALAPRRFPPGLCSLRFESIASGDEFIQHGEHLLLRHTPTRPDERLAWIGDGEALRALLRRRGLFAWID